MPASVDAVRKLLGSRLNVGGPTDQYGGAPVPEADVTLEIQRQYARVNAVLSSIYVFPLDDHDIIATIVNSFAAGYILHAHHQNDLERSPDGEYANLLIKQAQDDLDLLADRTIVLDGETPKTPITNAPSNYGTSFVGTRPRYNPWLPIKER